jgi:hypothetical protein
MNTHTTASSLIGEVVLVLGLVLTLYIWTALALAL